MRLKFVFPILLPLIASVAYGADIIYPAGMGAESAYEVSNLSPHVGDTITFTRTFVNKSAYSISDLYLSDNLPQSFAVISQSVTISGSPAPSGFESGSAGEITPGSVPYRWLLDNPGGSPNDTVQPGDSVHLEVNVTCNDAGQFTLNDHYSVGFGNGSAMFGVPGAPVQLNVTLETGVAEDSLLPRRYLTSTAYPNPFNAAATIEFTAASGKFVNLEIYDLLGRKVYEQRLQANSGSGRISWDAGQLGTGIYLYRLSDSKSTTRGKLLLLK